MTLIKINNVRIKGMAACVPSNIEENSDYPYFDPNEIDKIIPTIGVERRRIARKGETCSDYAYKAAKKLIEDLGWKKESIGLILYCSAARDYTFPDTACIIHGKLGLPTSSMAFDMTLGCTGWVYGMSTALSILQNGAVKRAILINGNMGSAENAFEDKTTWPLFSDAGTATALEYDESASPIYCELGTIGANYTDVMIPDGGRRNPVTADSMVLKEYGTNIKRTRLHQEMKGMEVFAFGLKTGPKSIDDVLAFAGKTLDDVDMFVFHQANYYLIKKIVKKAKLNPEKVPISMKNFGNVGPCCIPFAMVTEKAEQLRHGKYRVVGNAFGVGMSWGSLYFETEDLVIPDLLEFEEGDEKAIKE